MHITPELAEALTDDDYERMELLEPHMPDITPGDPYYEELEDIARSMALFAKDLPRNTRRAPYLFLKGWSYTKIAEELGSTPATVSKAVKSLAGTTIMALQQRLNILHEGPTLASRQNMLWRIAIREETDNPRISIQAIDALNKQQGVYAVDKDLVNQTPTVLIQQFNFPSHVRPVPLGEKHVNPKVTDTKQDNKQEFLPVTITVPTEATDG